MNYSPAKTGFGLACTLTGLLNASLCGAQGAEASGDVPLEQVTVVGKGYGLAVGAKSVEPLREVPNSVTLVDQKRIQEQNLFTITDLANQTVGLTTTGADSDLAQFMSRGFTIDDYLVDGVPNNGFTGEIPDLFLYDRVEILRGPAGLFSGSGSPAGSINLVRKRPLPTPTFQSLLGAGSWDNYRGEVDASMPYSGKGGVRGGVAYQNRDEFYDVAHQTRLVAFGVADYDVTGSTKITAGGHYDRYRGATFSGLPGLAGPDGQANGLPDLPRSTYAAADWNRSNFDTKSAFGEIRHETDSHWVFRASGQYGKTDTDLTTSYAVSFSGITPTDGTTELLASRLTRHQEYLTFDANAIGRVTLFGLSHDLLFGADFQRKTNLEGFSDRQDLGEFDLYHPDYNVPEPAFPVVEITDTHVRQYGFYGQGRFRLATPLSLVVGGRVSWYDSRVDSILPPGDTTDLNVSHRFTPYAGMVYDVTRHWTLYASYTNNFEPQDGTTPDGQSLRPMTGKQVEGGVKADLFAGVLLSLAVYRIEQTGRAQTDPLDPRFSETTGKVRSSGAEVEANGKILPGWTVSGGYAFNENKYEKDETNQGQPFTLASPRHSVKLWTNYEPAAFRRLSIGGGAVWQSQTEAFLNIFGTTGARQPGYAVVNARLGYRLTDRVSLGINLNNLLDRHYYERVAGTEFGNFYGAPRNVFGTIRMDF